MAESAFARTGAAARKPATTTPRVPRTRKASTAPRPAAAGSTSVAAPGDQVATRLAVALAAAEPAVRDVVLAFRPDGLDDAEWAAVAGLVRLGLAAVPHQRPSTVPTLGWALGWHARVQLAAGTSRTVTGWYCVDAVEATLTARRVHGEAVPVRLAPSFRRRLYAVAAALVPGTPALPPRFSHFAPQGPYTTAELEAVLDFCDRPTGRGAGPRRRLAALVWLVLGTGMFSGETAAATTADLRRGEHAWLVDIGGELPRAVPVLAAAEAPLLAAVDAAGEGFLLTGLRRDRKSFADTIVAGSGWSKTGPFPLRATRLRYTWLAAVLAAGAPLAGVLTAAGLVGERTFAHLLDRLPPLDDATYQLGLRGAATPLLPRGQLLLPGARFAAPRMPVLDPS